MKAWVCNLVTLTACLFFTLLSPGLAQYIPAGTMTPPITFTSPSAAVVPLTIKGAASQSANLLNLTNSADATQASVSASGAFFTPQINDSNGNEQIKFTATGSAVNEITVTNAATGNGPTISATGGDSNININLTPKGTGGLQVNSSGSTASNPRIIGVSPFLSGSNAARFQLGDANNCLQVKYGGILQAVSYWGFHIYGHTIGSNPSINIDGQTTDPALTVHGPGGATNTTLVVQQAASQTGDCQQWQNSSGTVLAAKTAGGVNLYNGTVTTINGSVAGTIKWSMPEQGTGYKKFVAVVSGYNDAAGATITFPTAFANTPNYFLSNGATVTVTSISTTQIVIPISAGTSGTIVVDGI